MKTCEAIGCKAEATTVISGRAFCGVHRDGSHVRNAPLRRCAVPDCGSAALGHGAQPSHCRHHQKFRLGALPAAIACLIALASSAHAGGTGSAMTGATVGTASAQALAANTITGYRTIVVINDSATATVACALTGAAVINGAGSVTLPPLAATGASSNRQTIGGVANVSIREPVNCIASAAATPVTFIAE